MSPHTKKFISYMVLALIVYILIYIALLGYMRMTSRDISDFCEQLEKGMSVAVIESRAHAENFSITSSHMTDNKTSQLFISSPDTSSATCQTYIIDGVLSDKKFILRVF